MNHFPSAFGTIVAVVLGGALLIDHNIKDSGTASRTTPPTTVAESKALSAATMARADAPGESPAGMVTEAGANKATKSPSKKLDNTSNASSAIGGSAPSPASTTTPSTTPPVVDPPNTGDNTTSTGNPPPADGNTGPKEGG